MKLDDYRKGAGLSYVDLAKRLGLEVSHVRRLCLGMLMPKIETARKIEAQTKRKVKISDWGRDEPPAQQGTA